MSIRAVRRRGGTRSLLALTLAWAGASAPGCFWVDGGDPPAGAPDGGVASCPSGLTFFGECDGTRLRYCADGEEVEVECGVPGLGVGECFELDAEIGNVCGTSSGEPCFFDDGEGGTYFVFCRAPANACSVGARGSACVTAEPCTDAEVGSCRGDDALVGCRRGQPVLVECDAIGGRCGGGRCVELGEGSFCDDELFLCGSELSCVDGTCTRGAPPPPPTDAGSPGADAGVPPSGCVHRGNLWITDQGSLDAFFASGCDEVTGNVDVNGTALSALRGLDNLRVVGGELEIVNNPALVDLSALSHLERVGALIVGADDALPSLDGLESLTVVEGLLSLYSLPSLTNVRGLRNLRRVGDEIGEESIIIIRNPQLTTLAGLEHLEVANYLTVEECPSLTSLDGLRNLRTVHHQVRLVDLGMLTLGMASLEHAGGLLLRDNDSATSISFPVLHTIDGGLLLNRHDALGGFSFGALTTLTGDLTIQLNPMLSECTVDDFVAGLQAGGYAGTVRTGGNLSCP
jgi:hypothetical protein